MKNYAFTLLSFVLVLAACSKDDTPLPEPLKVESITSQKNGNSADGFSMKITYEEPELKLDYITHKNVTDDFRYQGNEIYIYNSNKDITYKLSGNKIISYELKAKNPYKNTTYIYDKFLYSYPKGNYWETTKMEGNRVDEEGELISFESDVDHVFTWNGAVLKTYTANDHTLEFEYSTKIHPTNFPFRIVNSVDFKDGIIEGILSKEENFTPVNFMFGNNNLYLVESAKYYKKPDVNIILAKYNFEYEHNTEGYITNVEITEHIYDNNNNISTSNIYQITLSYK